MRPCSTWGITRWVREMLQWNSKASGRQEKSENGIEGRVTIGCRKAKEFLFQYCGIGKTWIKKWATRTAVMCDVRFAVETNVELQTPFLAASRGVLNSPLRSKPEITFSVAPTLFCSVFSRSVSNVRREKLRPRKSRLKAPRVLARTPWKTFGAWLKLSGWCIFWCMLLEQVTKFLPAQGTLLCAQTSLAQQHHDRQAGRTFDLTRNGFAEISN